MSRPGIFLVVLALALAAASAGGVLLLASERPASVAGNAEPDAALADPGTASTGDVCQGTIKRPAHGEPQRFAAQYTLKRAVLGLVIVGGSGVDEAAFDVAETTVTRMFARNPDLLAPLVAEGAYVIVLEAGQDVLDLPEFSCLAGQPGSAIYDHVCGVADRADYPVVTVSELDLLGNRTGPCRGLNVLFHELGHLVQGWVLAPADYIDVRLLYQAALDAGKYRGQYASRNSHEYFAEGVQAYFDSVDGSFRDRRWLEGYDPGLYALVNAVFGE